jgi:hypothetical protein
MIPSSRNALAAIGCALTLATTAAPAAAQTALAPGIVLLGDGSVLPAEIFVRPGSSPTSFLFNGGFSNAVFDFSFQGTSEADPFINWTIGVVNNGQNPLSLQFTFGQPTVGGPYDRLVNSFSGSVTDRRLDGASVTGLQGSAFLDGLLVPGSVVGSDCIAAPGATGACPALPAVQYGPASTSVPALNYGFLWSRLDLTLSPGDSATFTGSTVLDTAPAVVPVPASLPLLIAGLGIGALGWRRRRHA